MIFKKCIMTIANNVAKLDEDIYLYRLDSKCETIKYKSFKPMVIDLLTIGF